MHSVLPWIHTRGHAYAGSFSSPRQRQKILPRTGGRGQANPATCRWRCEINIVYFKVVGRTRLRVRQALSQRRTNFGDLCSGGATSAFFYRCCCCGAPCTSPSMSQPALAAAKRAAASAPAGEAQLELERQDASSHGNPLKRFQSGVEADSLMDRSATKVTHGFRVDTWTGGDQHFWWAMAAAQGRRPGMEDAHAVDLDVDSSSGTALFGVFDGHAGREVALFCARNIGRQVLAARAWESGDLEGALSEAFLQLEGTMQDQGRQAELYNLMMGHKPSSQPHDEDYKRYGHFDQEGQYLGPQAGCTACVALVRGSRLAVASVGDTRCVLSQGGRAVALTEDHKPSNPQEAQRVMKAGLAVIHGRVLGQASTLAMSRALGDVKYKQLHLAPEHQAVSPVPDTTSLQVQVAPPGTTGSPAHPSPASGPPGGRNGGRQQRRVGDFLIIACDGVWDVMSNQAAVNFVHTLLSRGYGPREVATALVDECLAAEQTVTPVSMDNVTVLLVLLEGMPQEQQAAATNSKRASEEQQQLQLSS